MGNSTLVEKYLWTCSYLNEHGQWMNSIFYAINEAEAMHKVEKQQIEKGRAIMTIHIAQQLQGLILNETVYPGTIRYEQKNEERDEESVV